MGSYCKFLIVPLFMTCYGCVRRVVCCAVLCSSQASLRPLVAEVVLTMQQLARPRPITPGHGGQESTSVTKMTSTVLLTSPIPSTHATTIHNSPLNSYHILFDNLLTDSVDVSLRLKLAPESEVVDGFLKYSAGACSSRFIVCFMALLGTTILCTYEFHVSPLFLTDHLFVCCRSNQESH